LPSGKPALDTWRQRDGFAATFDPMGKNVALTPFCTKRFRNALTTELELQSSMVSVTTRLVLGPW
jgi:hypothetical protein